jgi:hypothetical protein
MITFSPGQPLYKPQIEGGMRVTRRAQSQQHGTTVRRVMKGKAPSHIVRWPKR